MADQDLSKMKVAELRDMLKSKGLNSVGNKQELVERLQAAMYPQTESSGDLNEDDLLNDDELEMEKSLLDSTHDEILKSPSVSTKSTSPEVVPPKKISLKRNISIVVPVVESKPEEAAAEATEGSTDEPEKKVVKISELTAKDRLELRAKKFAGSQVTPASTEAAQERLSARAARFGKTLSPEKTADSKTAITSSVSLEVLKKRAERFGAVTVPELKQSELQEKLQKRQERFGASEKVAITAPKSSSGSDSDYKEKALKRLERFKQAA